MDRAMQIIQIIEKNPGIKFREIMRETGMKNGVLEYYAAKLEKEGTVKVERTPGQTRFYPPGTSDEETILIKNLRQETPKQILAALLQYKMMSFGEIVREIKKSPATASLYLSQMTRDGIIKSTVIDSRKAYFVYDEERLQGIVDKYHPSILESSAEHLADTFSLL